MGLRVMENRLSLGQANCPFLFASYYQDIKCVLRDV